MNVRNNDENNGSERIKRDPVRMQPFDRDDIDLVRRTLRAKKDYRQLALFNCGVDAMLRGGDLVRLRVSDVREPSGKLRDSNLIRMSKTGKAVECFFYRASHEALTKLLEQTDKWASDYLFTRDGDPHGKHITETTLRRMVKDWARMAHKDPSKFSSHSLRRTRPSIIYAETHDIESVKELLGHSSVTATSAYLNIGRAKVAEVSKRFEV